MQIKLTEAATGTGTGTAVTWSGDDPSLSNPGYKTCQAWVSGTGAVTGTIDVYSSIDGRVYSKRFTITLSGTTTDSWMGELTSRATYWRADVTAITGTSAKIYVVMEV